MLVVQFLRRRDLVPPALVLLLPEVGFLPGLLDVFAVGPAGDLVDSGIYLWVERFDPQIIWR